MILKNEPTSYLTANTECGVVYSFQNECEPITIYPLGAECFVTDVNKIGNHDGSIYINVTGGTPPYFIVWNNGNYGPYINNLGVGTYTAVIVDYYGDFSSTTTCTVLQPTLPPSPTPTPTPSPLPNTIDFCLELKLKNCTTTNLHFNPNGSLNGQFAWIDDSSVYSIYWDGTKWVLDSWTCYTVINNNPSSPPITGWSILGTTGSVTGYLGSCASISSLKMTITTNDPVKGSDGNIVITASDGTSPYLYSIDGGTSYHSSPIFKGLKSGIYAVQTQDFVSDIVYDSITLKTPPPSKTYSVSLNTVSRILSYTLTTYSVEYTTTINVFPTLPSGVTINFDLTHTNDSEVSPSLTSSTISTSSVLTKNMVIVPQTTTVTTGETVNTLVLCGSQTVYLTSETDLWNLQTLNNTDSLYITTTTTKIRNTNDICYVSNSNDTYSIYNVTILGCSPCNVIVN